MSSNLFEKAQDFYKDSHPKFEREKNRRAHIKQLMLIIETAPFLTQEEKTHFLYLIPIYPLSTILSVKQSLIEQGLFFLHLNPEQKDKLKPWLSLTR